MVCKNKGCFYELNLKQKVYSAEYMAFEMQFQRLNLNGKRELGVPFVSDIPYFCCYREVSCCLKTGRRSAVKYHAGVTFRNYNYKIVVSCQEWA